MQIAYLVMAHDRPGHLARLVSSLAHDDAFIFVHVDAKADLGPFEQAARAHKERLIFLGAADRIRVSWGHVSCVEATLKLMDAASRHPVNFGRYVLLSGADYPIKGASEVRRVLSDPKVEYMQIWQQLTPDRREYSYVSRRHVMGLELANPKSPTYGRFDRRLARKVIRTVLRRLPDRGAQVGSVALYQGSQWWALTDSCVQYIRNYCAQHPEYLRFFRWVAGGDEIFFHSLVQNSPFAENLYAEHRARRDECTHGVHYLDWNPRAGHSYWSPKALEEVDLAAMDASPALFARKFDESISGRLLDALDARYL